MKKRIVFAVIFVLCMTLLCGCGSSSSSKTYSAKCKYCGRTFSYKAENYGNQAQKNVSNIHRTNLCLSCYNTYKSLSGY